MIKSENFPSLRLGNYATPNYKNDDNNFNENDS